MAFLWLPVPLDVGMSKDNIFGDPARGIRGAWHDTEDVPTTGIIKHIPEERIKFTSLEKFVTTTKVPLKNDEVRQMILWMI